MLKIEGLFLGAATVPGEERQGPNGPYQSQERYVVAVGTADADTLPEYHNCESRQVMESIRSASRFGQPVSLRGRRAQYGRLVVVGADAVTPSARAS